VPLLSIVIPTYDRPVLLGGAIASALRQTLDGSGDDIEVIVVDDGSPEPVAVPDHPRLRLVRLPENRGVAAARNAGAEAARGRWLTYLDDDDELLPSFAETSLRALAETTLPAPVAALSGLLVVREDGTVVETRMPPTIPRGGHFNLERVAPDLSFFSKQTLVVEREVLLDVGGYDEALRTREHTDLFLRLNPVCSLLGVPVVAYRHLSHGRSRLSKDPASRQCHFERLVRKHDALLRAHPRGFARFLFEHAVTSWEMGQRTASAASVLRAARHDPVHTAALLASVTLRRRWTAGTPTPTAS
jgi:glycosyltransferase involved in cell wall biosynthesis